MTGEGGGWLRVRVQQRQEGGSEGVLGATRADGVAGRLWTTSDPPPVTDLLVTGGSLPRESSEARGSLEGGVRIRGPALCHVSTTQVLLHPDVILDCGK